MVSKKISEAFFLNSSTIHRYRASYENSGLEVLIYDAYIGKRCKLAADDLEKLGVYLESTVFLSSNEVAAFILDEFGLSYSVSGTTALHRRLGFSYRKPDPKAQAAFHKGDLQL